MKKPEKKKAGKKKAAEDNAPKLSSKALQRDFDKKMKNLVRDIKKETQATIKNALKEAKRKLNEGSELIMTEVLQAIETTVSNPEASETQQKNPKGKKALALAAAAESNDEAPAVEAQTATRLTGARKTKSLAPVAPKPVVTRRRRTAAEEAPAEAPTAQDQE